jgi:GDP-L-fucose synthase
MKLAEAVRKQYKLPWITAIPCNLYGPGDNFDPEKSHVISGLVRKFVLAKNVGKTAVLWGTGKPRREILHVEDAAEACILAAEKFDGATINVGSGKDYSIAALAHVVASVIGYEGEIGWDASRPDGMPRKCMDVSRLTALGFEPRVSLEEGIKRMVGDFNKLLAR